MVQYKNTHLDVVHNGGLQRNIEENFVRLSTEFNPKDTLVTLANTSGEDLPDGASIRVSQLRESFVLVKSSALAPVTNLIIPAIGGGNWIRSGQPDQSWVHQEEWYVGPGGVDTNTGASSGQRLLTVQEFLRRTTRNFNYARAGITVNITGSLSTTQSITIDALMGNREGAYSFLYFNGQQGVTAAASGTITGVVECDPATLQEHTITAVIGGWGPHVGRIGKITSGAREGARFVVLKDLGGDTAHISQPGLGEYDSTRVALQIGDTFQIDIPPTMGDIVDVRGCGEVSFANLAVGSGVSSAHSLVLEGTQTFLDCCVFPGGCDADRASYVDAFNCYFENGLRAYFHSEFHLEGGGCAASASPIARQASQINYLDFSSFSSLRTEFHSVHNVLGDSWLALFDASATIQIASSSSLDSNNNARIWGKGVTGPMINIKPGGSMYYTTGLPPNITGSGAEISVGGTGGATTFVGLPSFNANNGAKAVIG